MEGVGAGTAAVAPREAHRIPDWARTVEALRNRAEVAAAVVHVHEEGLAATGDNGPAERRTVAEAAGESFLAAPVSRGHGHRSAEAARAARALGLARAQEAGASGAGGGGGVALAGTPAAGSLDASVGDSGLCVSAPEGKAALASLDPAAYGGSATRGAATLPSGLAILDDVLGALGRGPPDSWGEVVARLATLRRVLAAAGTARSAIATAAGWAPGTARAAAAQAWFLNSRTAVRYNTGARAAPARGMYVLTRRTMVGIRRCVRLLCLLYKVRTTTTFPYGESEATARAGGASEAGVCISYGLLL